MDKQDISALTGAGGASIVPLFIQSYISGFGPIGLFVVMLVFGYASNKIVREVY